MFTLGALIFTFIIGVFTGFIAFSVVDRPDLDKQLKDAIDREDYRAARKIQDKIDRIK